MLSYTSDIHGTEATPTERINGDSWYTTEIWLGNQRVTIYGNTEMFRKHYLSTNFV